MSEAGPQHPSATDASTPNPRSASRRGRGLALASALGLTLLAGQAAAATAVCVTVEVKQWTEAAKGADGAEAAPNPEAEALRKQLAERITGGYDANDPYQIDPARYLERLVRYEVTHDVGFEAMDTGCAEQLKVELYPLGSGWTVFARYSGHAREEKVDQVSIDEFGPLAERLTRALLWDTPITEVINRTNVLRADSQTDLRRIRGEGHFVLALGTQVRVGNLPTASAGGAPEDLRILTPLSVQMGYRGKYKAWGLDVFARGALGTQSQAPRRNPEGGHVDFDFSGGAGLHFLRYFDAVGITSFYLGGGAQFEVSRFSVVRAEANRGNEDHERLVTGGLNLDLVLGYEFMRTSRVHFYLQAEAHVPTFQLQTEVDSGGVDTWLPGGLLQIGMVF
jgi:hypothetical protein